MRPTMFVALLAIPAQLAFAQQAPVTAHDLTLDQAIAIARQNNPALLQTKELVHNADATVRQAYASLLPNASASVGGGFTQGGTQIVQGVQIGQGNPDSYNGRYSLGLNYNINGAVAFAPRAARANRAASQANVVSSSEALRSNVTTQYIQALEQEATAALNDTLVQSAQGQLDLANAKMKVGAGTILDVRNAEVALGQAEVNALTAHNQARIEKVKLFQQMGVAPDTGAVLTTKFTVVAPPGSLDSLLQLARRVNPDLAARKSTEFADQMQVRSAETAYLPSLSLSTGIGGTSFATAQSVEDRLASAQRAVANQAATCLSRDSLRTGAGLSPIGGCGTGLLEQSQIDAIRTGNSPFQF